jgi:energy-coupling factor transporter transmembrane protein EcfT
MKRYRQVKLVATIQNGYTRDLAYELQRMDITYKRHRYPAAIISYATWLYYRFTLSLRDVSELLFQRGITYGEL